jgi:hypothetical protein
MERVPYGTPHLKKFKSRIKKILKRVILRGLLEKLGRGFLGDDIKKVKKNLAQFFLLYRGLLRKSH